MFMGQFGGPLGAPAAKRFKVFEPGLLRYGRTQHRIHLLDLSVSGALAHADDAPVPGTMVLVESGELRAVARVVWAKGQRFGLAFGRPLSDDQIARVLK